MAEDMIEKLVMMEEARLPGWRCLAIQSSVCADGTWYYAQVERAQPYYFIAASAERTQREAVQTAFAQARQAQGERSSQEQVREKD